MPKRQPKTLALLDDCMQHYMALGLPGLTATSLRHAGLLPRLKQARVSKTELLERLQVSREMLQSLKKTRTPAFRHTRESFLKAFSALVEELQFFPPQQWLRLNGYKKLVSSAKRLKISWSVLRNMFNAPSKDSKQHIALNGLCWQSRPEACLSDFLAKRQIPHWIGQQYSEADCKALGVRYASFDMLIGTPCGPVDVEVVSIKRSDLSEVYTDRKDGYVRRHEQKHALLKNRPNYLEIQANDCYAPSVLEALLEPFFLGAVPSESGSPVLKSAHVKLKSWVTKDELAECLRYLSTQTDDGFMPSQVWLEKRGKFANRSGPKYTAVASAVQKFFGGFTEARKYLGQPYQRSFSRKKRFENDTDFLANLRTFLDKTTQTPGYFLAAIRKVCAECQRQKTDFEEEMTHLAYSLYNYSYKYFSGGMPNAVAQVTGATF